MKKWTEETVSQYVEKYRYELLRNSDTPFDTSKITLKCPKGHVYSVSFRTFLRGCRCKKCMYINNRRSESEVRQFIEESGYKLLSRYEKDEKKILVECPMGHRYYVKFSNFKNGKRCAICKNVKKYEFSEVKQHIESAGYKLLSKKYLNVWAKLRIQCPEGHIYSTSFVSFRKGSRCPVCWKLRMKGITGKPPRWKGGIRERNIPLYDTYAHQLDWCEEVRRDPDNEDLLQVRCYESSCRKWFTPTLTQVSHRIQALKGNTLGEYHLYCSDECKSKCSIYRKHPNSKLNIESNDLTRELQPELREIVFERDNWTCQKCGSTEDLQCHHILPVKLEPIESADVDNCITLCKKCHKEVHQQAGCTFGELRNAC